MPSGVTAPGTALQFQSCILTCPREAPAGHNWGLLVQLDADGETTRRIARSISGRETPLVPNPWPVSRVAPGNRAQRDFGLGCTDN